MTALLLFVLSASAAEDPVAVQYQESYALESAYSYQRALDKLDGIPATGADAWMVPLRRGWLLYLLGRYEESVAAYDLAVKNEPAGAIEAALGRTLPLMALRRWTEVERDCHAVLAAEPNAYTAQSRLAYAFYNAGDHAAAVGAYAILVAAYPSDVSMRTGLAWAQLKAGQTDEARKNFLLVLHLVPDYASAKEGLKALTP